MLTAAVALTCSGRRRVLPGLLLVAEQADGDDDDVEVPAGERLLDRRGVGRGVLGVEVDDGDLVPGAGEALHGGVAPGGGPCGEDDPQPGADPEPLHHRQADVGGPADHEHGRGRADGVHHSASLLARSDVKTRSGSTRPRTAHHSSSRGYMRRRASGASRASLAR